MVQEIGEIMAKDLLPETRDDFYIENSLRSSLTLELDNYSTDKDKQNIWELDFPKCSYQEQESKKFLI